jgi:hypothetical protein
MIKYVCKGRVWLEGGGGCMFEGGMGREWKRDEVVEKL